MDHLPVEDCDVCGETHSTEQCPELGLNTTQQLLNSGISRARITLPYYLQAVNLPDQEVGVFAQQPVSCKSQFGPYEAKKTTHEFNDDGLFMLKIFTKDGGSVSLDTTDENECNWLCLVRAATEYTEQNCMAYQLGTSIFYNTTRDIKIGEEMKVWYAPQYARKLGKPTTSDGISKVMLGMKVLYPTVDELPEVPMPCAPAADEPVMEDHTPPDMSSKYELIASMPLEEPGQEELQELKADMKETLVVFACKRCDEKFDTEIELGSHIREHLLPPPRRGGRKTKQKSLEGGSSMKSLLSSLKLNRNENATKMLYFQDEEGMGSDEDDDFGVAHDSGDDFSPKQISNVKSPNKRVMPKRSLRGVRTTGFEEYVVMTKSVAKRKRQVSDGEESSKKHEVSVGNIMVVDGEKQRPHKMLKTNKLGENTNNNAKIEIKRKRGRPRKKPEDEEISEQSGLTKDNDLDLEKDEDTAEDGCVNNELSENLENKLLEGEVKNRKSISENEAEKENNDTNEEIENNENTEKTEIIESVSREEKEKMKKSDRDDKNVTTDMSLVNQSDSFSQTEYDLEPEVLNDMSDLNKLEQGHRDPTDVKGQKVEVGSLEHVDNKLCEKSGEKSAETQENILTESFEASENSISVTDEKSADEDTEKSVAEPQSIEEIMESEASDKSVAEPQSIEEIMESEASDKLVAENLDKTVDDRLEVKTKGLETLDDVIDIISEKTDLLNSDRLDMLKDESLNSNIGEKGELETSAEQGNIDDSSKKESCDEKENEVVIEIVNDEDNEGSGTEKDVKEVKGEKTKFKGRKFKEREKPIIPMIVRETDKGCKEYICTVCNKKFTTERYLRLHAPAHTDKFKCRYCGSRYTRKDSFEKHECKIQEYLSFEKKFIEDGEDEDLEKEEVIVRCKKCDINFETEEDGKRHVLEQHIADPLFCDWCQKSFSTQKHYKVHRCVSKTDEDKKFLCDICSQAFVNERFLFRHMAMHTDIFKCKNCGKRYSRKDSLQRHVLKCCPDNIDDYDLFVCRTCMRVFSTEIGLQNHENSCKSERLRCYTCNKVFFTQETLDSHECKGSMGSKIGEVKFSCNECHKSFKNLDYLKRHKRKHEGQFKCSICEKNCKSEEEKITHFRFCKAAKEVRDEGTTKCENCTETFATLKGYREHYFLHTHPYKCDRCRRHFVKIGSLHTHICENDETLSGDFSCHICLKEFMNAKSLNRHVESHGEYKYYCDMCSKRFHRKDVFMDHMCKMADGSSLRVIRHDDQIQVLDKLVCHICGKSFISSSNLNKHMKLHADKKCECPVCGKKFHQDEYLKMHIAGVHEKKFKFQCSECGKVFMSKPGLMAHMKANHATTREVYPCPTCGKIFNQKGNMKTHMYSHTKDRLFHCKFCPKTFKYPDQLNRHKLVHTMENKLQCEHCDRTFVKSYDLNRHYQVTHSGMMYVCEFCNARCSHRHTVMRHYKRKHPAHADLIKDTEYLNSIFKVVDKEYKEEYVKELSQDTSQILIGERGEILPQTAAEVLHSLSSGGPGNVANIQTVHVTDDGIIDSAGMMVVPTGNDETFSVQSLQPNSQSIVILQIVNPQDADQILTEEVQVQELETTQIIETTPIPDVATDAVAEEITAVTTFVQNFGS